MIERARVAWAWDEISQFDCGAHGGVGIGGVSMTVSCGLRLRGGNFAASRVNGLSITAGGAVRRHANH